MIPWQIQLKGFAAGRVSVRAWPGSTEIALGFGDRGVALTMTGNEARQIACALREAAREADGPEAA